MPKKILITGANGLLGQKLVELLSTQPEIELIATSRGKCRLPEQYSNYQYHPLDITQPMEVVQLLAELQPDCLIHTAAMTNVDQCENEQEACWEMNVNAVQYLVDACARHDIFLLHLSTDFIFDGLNGPYSEDAEAFPVSHYGESKLAAERIIRQSNIRWAIARTVLVYGIAHDMSRTNIILWVKKSLEEEKTIQVVNDQWRTPTLAEDLAIGCWLIVQREAQGIFNISGKDFLTPYEMAIKTAAFFSLDPSFIRLADSSTFTQPAKRPPRTGFILTKACSVLGYDPRSFEEGIAVLARQIGVR